ncbi:MAG: hypothetical protein ABWJ97_06180 [Thermoproteus sp.]
MTTSYLLRIEPAVRTPLGLGLYISALYLSTAPAAVMAFLNDPLGLLAPLVVGLRAYSPLAPLVALLALAPVRPYDALLVAVIELLMRIRLITTARVDGRLSTLNIAVKVLLSAALLAAVAIALRVPGIEISDLGGLNVTYTPSNTGYANIVTILYTTASLGLIFGAMVDGHLDGYIRYLYLYGRPASAKPLYTLAWLLAAALPVALSPRFDAARHLAILALTSALVWAVKPKIYSMNSIMAYLVGMYLAGFLLQFLYFPAALAVIGLLPFLPRLVEVVWYDYLGLGELGLRAEGGRAGR